MQPILNKQGKGGSNIAIIISIIVVVALAVGALMIFGIPQRYTGSDEGLKENLKITGCEVEPYVNIIATDVINGGTEVTDAEIGGGILNGNFVGGITDGSSGDSFILGDKITGFVNGTNYVAVKLDEKEIKNCGENKIPIKMCKLDGSPTIKIYNDGNSVVTDTASGGAVNQTSSANAIVMRVKVTMPLDECTNEMVFVIENTNNTEVQTIGLTSVTSGVSVQSISKPDVHAQESTVGTTRFASFRASGLKGDGGVTEFDLTFEPTSSTTMGTGDNNVYVTWYIPQAFIDTDGSIKVDVENADNSAKHVSAASSDYDFSIGNV